MDFDDRPDSAKRLETARKNRGFKSAREACSYFGWNYSTYLQHENGIRGFVRAAARYAKAYRVSEGWLITGQNGATSTSLPVMGYIGAGAEILPEFAQVPPEGGEQIEVPFAIANDMIGLQVRGDSMIPRYDDGDVVVVYREQRRAIESFYGEEAAVRTSDGRRFLKQIMRAPEGVTLLSWNARPIENVNLEWIGEIYATIRSAQLRRHGRRK